MRVLVTGGCGYKGAVLVPKLLAAGHQVRIFDIGWFGLHAPRHADVMVTQGDIRHGVAGLEWAEAVVHLAGIANDPCGDLDARLTWDVNALGTFGLAKQCIAAGVPRFIFASSASIYGIKDSQPVSEDAEFAPVSDYNKTKMVAEKLLSTLPADRLNVQVVRPATICGVSPRQRLDVVVNMLTAQALERGEITAHCGPHGGALMRPHMHIDDVADLYLWLLEHPEQRGPFNAASENQTVADTATIIAGVIPSKVTISGTADKRSYAVDFSRLLAAGFTPKKTVGDAVEELAAAWAAGEIRRTPMSTNLTWMQSNGWARG